MRPTQLTTIEKITALNCLAKNINPTQIYNENWMIRLLVGESIGKEVQFECIDFSNLANWSSEALISSPFLRGTHNEGYTHADIILGDFNVDYETSGKISLSEPSKQLGIIEAKMGSDLSQGTANAKKYNQASRSVCCLAHVTEDKHDCDIFFAVVVPAAKERKIKDQVTLGEVSNQIKCRYSHSQKTYPSEIQKRVEKCNLSVITYEKWIDRLTKDELQDKLKDFYEKCLKHNKVS